MISWEGWSCGGIGEGNWMWCCCNSVECCGLVMVGFLGGGGNRGIIVRLEGGSKGLCMLDREGWGRMCLGNIVWNWEKEVINCEGWW